MNKECISVIIPVYNAEQTIGRCIDSLLAQTHSNIEIICIVDGGVDSSADILRRYASRDSRVKVIEQDGGGPATARNAGLDAATGGYIGFVDADDWIDPDMYERLLAAICGAADYGKLGDDSSYSDVYELGSAEPCPRYEIANCGHVRFFPEGTERIVVPELEGHFASEDAQRLGRLIESMPDFIWDKLFDARIIQKEGIRFPDGRVYGEDTVFLLKYLNHVKHAVFVGTPFYHYNAHSEGSITNTISDRWYDIFENLKDILFYYKEHLNAKDFEVITPCLARLCIRYYDRRANAMMRYGEKDFQIRYVRDSFMFLSRHFPDWKALMKQMPDVVFPRVKTSLFLMRLYIIAPGFLKRRYAERLMR